VESSPEKVRTGQQATLWYHLAMASEVVEEYKLLGFPAVELKKLRLEDYGIVLGDDEGGQTYLTEIFDPAKKLVPGLTERQIRKLKEQFVELELYVGPAVAMLPMRIGVRIEDDGGNIWEKVDVVGGRRKRKK